MKKILAWVKANPIILLSVVLAVVSLAGLVVIHSMGSGLRQRMSERASIATNAHNAKTSSVTLPATRPDTPGESVRMTINEASIKHLDRIMGDIQAQFTSITQMVAQFNQRPVMQEGLFPEPPEGALRIDIKTTYRRLLMNMLGRPKADWPLAAVAAGMPPTQQEIMTAVDAATKEFLTVQIFPPKPLERLTDRERERLRAERQKKFMEVLTDRARSIHIYAAVPRDINLITVQEFPLDMTALPSPAEPILANVDQIWEAQMSLWIQSDILRAIANVNRVGEIGASVLDAPVKRLIRLKVVPGYVGIESDGAFKSLPGVGALAASAAPAATITDDFARSPSGRVSNHMYDVRHAQLSVVVEVRRLPEFIDALSRVNFMSVLSVDIQPVDEYAALLEGYVYGSEDVAQVELVIETIWFRQWTEKLMPKSVKQRLQIPLPAEPAPAN